MDDQLISWLVYFSPARAFSLIVRGSLMRGLEAVVTAVALLALTGCSWFGQKDLVQKDNGWAPLAGRAPGGARELIGGTGFILPGGYILTAGHVAKECKAIRATARSGAFEAAPAKVAALPSNPQMDLALLQLDPAVAQLGRGARLRDLWPTGLEPARPGAPASPWPKVEQHLVVLGY